MRLAMVLVTLAVAFSGCAALNDPALLNAALIMQGNANAMAQPVHLTSCSPNGANGYTCWNPL